MEPGGEDSDGPQIGRTTEGLLDSWKEIAGYLQRDVRTVMRWERARALPVHRLPGAKKAAVWALKSEVDAWRAAGPPPDNPACRDGTADGAAAPARVRALRVVAVLLATAMVPAAVAGVLLLRPAWHNSPPSSLIRSLVVLPFDSLNQDAQQDYLADGIQDALITELARGASRRRRHLPAGSIRLSFVVAGATGRRGHSV